MMLERIDTFCLKVRDVERASEWYQEKLGLKETFRDDGYRILSVGDSSVPITIEEGETSESHHQSYPIFFTSAIDETYETLKNRGVEVGELQRDEVNRFFDLYDLDENRLQVCFWE
ncbi:VOC family protein [Guptibacillus algicola]|uniref:VOC family protein n=1 Tax=Guptibacillus algicola TaxID=225844 RepID=UPI001CD4495A|nr:VOC family protein [Alkalihalobacillus algicola]MCA0987501.1 VOC family protein [Alkalihalobacillus algicola]